MLGAVGLAHPPSAPVFPQYNVTGRRGEVATDGTRLELGLALLVAWGALIQGGRGLPPVDQPPLQERDLTRSHARHRSLPPPDRAARGRRVTGGRCLSPCRDHSPISAPSRTRQPKVEAVGVGVVVGKEPGRRPPDEARRLLRARGRPGTGDLGDRPCGVAIDGEQARAHRKGCGLGPAGGVRRSSNRRREPQHERRGRRRRCRNETNSHAMHPARRLLGDPRGREPGRGVAQGQRHRALCCLMGQKSAGRGAQCRVTGCHVAALAGGDGQTDQSRSQMPSGQCPLLRPRSAAARAASVRRDRGSARPPAARSRRGGLIGTGSRGLGHDLLRDDDGGAVRSGQGLESAGDIDGIAHHGELELLPAADVAAEDRAEMMPIPALSGGAPAARSRRRARPGGGAPPPGRPHRRWAWDRARRSRRRHHRPDTGRPSRCERTPRSPLGRGTRAGAPWRPWGHRLADAGEAHEIDEHDRRVLGASVANGWSAPASRSTTVGGK